MTATWRSEPLAKVCQLITRGISPAYLDSAGIAVLNQKCVRDHSVNFDLGRRHNTNIKQVSPEKLLRTGDVLVNSTGTGTLGRVAQVRERPHEPTTVDSHVTIVRPTDGLFFPEFFGYALIAIEEQIQEGGEGCGGQTELARSKLANHYRVSFPSDLRTQRRIVAVLDEAFVGIATARANAEQNLQNVRGLPVESMRNILRNAPSTWTRTTIGDQVTLQRGFDITKDQQRHGPVPVVSSGGIKSYHDTPMVSAPGVVMGRKGTLGKVYFLDSGFWPHDTTLWIKDFKGNNPRFVYHFFSALDVQRLDSGAANPALNRNQVHPISVAWPPVDKQEEIADRCDGVCAMAEKLAVLYKRKLDALEELKKSLLHQAFSGELTARQTSEVMAEVV